MHTDAVTPILLGQQCWKLLRPFAVAKLLTGFKLCTPTPNNTQQHTTTRNSVRKRKQHVTPSNIQSCWPTILRLFARRLRMTLKIGGYKETSKAQSRLVNSATRTILASPQRGFTVGGTASLCQIYFYSEKKIPLNTITGEKCESKLVYKEPNKPHSRTAISLRRTVIH